MSTFPEYLCIGPRMEDQPVPWKRPMLVEQYYGQDDYSEFVVFNAYNNGANLAGAWRDDFGTQFYQIYNGFYTEDLRAFNLGAEDFTIRLQFGLGSHYDYNELEGEFYIPILTLGDLPTVNSPFFLAMTNPGRPTNVQKGDFIFSMKDDAGHEAYCYISSNDWYLPTFPTVMHLEFSRNGQIFTLKYNGLYGQKVSSNTFPNFGSVNISAVIRAYILSSSGFGSVNSTIKALQITKGISRNVGPNCAGAYTVPLRYPKSPMLERKQSSFFVSSALIHPVVGLEKIFGGKGYVFGEESLHTDHLSTKSAAAVIAETAQIVTIGGPPETDPYWSSVAIMFNVKSYTSGSMSSDAKGNAIVWDVNYNYNWYTVDAPLFETVGGETGLESRGIGDSRYPDYAGYVRRMTLSQPASVDLSGDFTIEMFLYLDYSPADWNRLLVNFGGSIYTQAYGFRVFHDEGGLNYYFGGNPGAYFNQVLYFAVTRASGVMKLWLHGVEVASMSGFTTNLSGQAVFGYDGYRSINTGNLISARITPGVARAIAPRLSTEFPSA